MNEPTPSLIVLAGPNGAGKTSSARTILAETLQLMTFVNADTIAHGLAGFEPESAAFEASRIMLERMYGLTQQRASFAFETTLAARSLAFWLKKLQSSNYKVHLVYFWLKSADMAVARVAQRGSARRTRHPRADDSPALQAASRISSSYIGPRLTRGRCSITRKRRCLAWWPAALPGARKPSCSPTCGRTCRKREDDEEKARPSIHELVTDSQLMSDAVARGIREAILQHARAGRPVSAWRDGKVVWVPPEEILAQFAEQTPPPALRLEQTRRELATKNTKKAQKGSQQSSPRYTRPCLFL